jgi:pSer/pThr/pTyr-binding forkhead associated (FHA) protein
MLASKQWLFGRGPDCDVVIPHPAVSVRHCRLVHTSQGWFLEDLQSTNGTYVNGVRIQQAVPVHPGDQILLAGQVPLPWLLP